MQNQRYITNSAREEDELVDGEGSSRSIGHDRSAGNNPPEC